MHLIQNAMLCQKVIFMGHNIMNVCEFPVDDFEHPCFAGLVIAEEL
jgi:hypothetical protein